MEKLSRRYKNSNRQKVVIFTLLALLYGAALNQCSSPTPVSTPIHFPVAEIIEIKPMTFDEAQSVVSFEIPQPAYLPQGLALKGARSQAPDWDQVFYTSNDVVEAGFGYEVSLGSSLASYAYPESAKVIIIVAGVDGTCIQGAENEFGEWMPNADATALQWSKLEFNYRMSQGGLELNCLDLVKIAESFDVQ